MFKPHDGNHPTARLLYSDFPFSVNKKTPPIPKINFSTVIFSFPSFYKGLIPPRIHNQRVFLSLQEAGPSASRQSIEHTNQYATLSPRLHFSLFFSPYFCYNTPMETQEQPILSVSELSLSLKSCVEQVFAHVRVRGEVSGLKTVASGHTYFSLKDKDSVLSAAI